MAIEQVGIVIVETRREAFVCRGVDYPVSMEIALVESDRAPEIGLLGRDSLMSSLPNQPVLHALVGPARQDDLQSMTLGCEGGERPYFSFSPGISSFRTGRIRIGWPSSVHCISLRKKLTN